MTSGTVITVGRNPGSTLQTKNPSVSRNHAQILEENGTWVVKDLGSSNSTFINGDKVMFSALKAGDVVRFGDFAVKVQEVAGARAPEPSRVDAAPPIEAGGADPRAEARQRERAEREARLREERERRRRERDGAAVDPQAAATATPDAPARDGRAGMPNAREITPSSARESAPGFAPREAVREVPREPSAVGAAARGAVPTSAPVAASSPPLGRHADPAELRAARNEVASLQAQLKDTRARVEELERRCRELEVREQRHDEELDGWHERYNRVREQLDHSQDLVARAREDLSDRDDTIDELQRQVSDLESQLAAYESKGQESLGQLSELKAKVVQKDRRIDELQRELDLMEYDLRAAREEIEALQDSFNHDNSEQRRLEREIQLLREVIAEKENHVSALKLEIEDQSREIYDLKMGTGMKDLEQARRDVLEKYFEKNREADELREKVRVTERKVEEMAKQLADAEARLNEQRDITSHPDYKRKLREMERLQADLDEARAEAERNAKRLDDFGPESKAKLEAQLNFLERKNKALQDKLDDALADLEAARKAAAAAPPPEATQVRAAPEPTGEVQGESVLKARAVEHLDEVMETYASWKTNMNLLRTYVDEATDAAKGGGDVKGAVQSIRELLVVVLADATELRSELKNMQELLSKD